MEHNTVSSISLDYIEVAGQRLFCDAESENDHVVSAVFDLVSTIDLTHREPVILSTVSSFTE